MKQPGHVPHRAGDPEVRSFDDLRDSGLLWLINTTVFHPRGYAIGLHYTGPNGTGVADGWQLFGHGAERIAYDESEEARLDMLFDKVKELLP